MSRYCVDTSAYSHFKRGAPDIVACISRARWLGVPTVVLGELYTGFSAGKRGQRNEAELHDFLRHPDVQVLPVDGEVARIYAEIIGDLRQAGTPLPTNDVWIAAVAARAGATVLTSDAHFKSIHRVGSQVFTVPTGH